MLTEQPRLQKLVVGDLTPGLSSHHRKKEFWWHCQGPVTTIQQRKDLLPRVCPSPVLCTECGKADGWPMGTLAARARGSVSTPFLCCAIVQDHTILSSETTHQETGPAEQPGHLCREGREVSFPDSRHHLWSSLPGPLLGKEMSLVEEVAEELSGVSCVQLGSGHCRASFAITS